MLKGPSLGKGPTIRTHTIQEEYDPKVHGESTEKKLQSIINNIGEQSTLLLMAVSDCIVNKKSQGEIARKYGIPRSRVQ